MWKFHKAGFCLLATVIDVTMSRDQRSAILQKFWGKKPKATTKIILTSHQSTCPEAKFTCQGRVLRYWLHYMNMLLPAIIWLLFIVTIQLCTWCRVLTGTFCTSPDGVTICWNTCVVWDCCCCCCCCCGWAGCWICTCCTWNKFSNIGGNI